LIAEISATSPSLPSPARSAVFLKITSGAASACPIIFLHSVIHTIGAAVSKNLCPWRAFSRPSRNREIRLGPVTGLDRIPLAMALIEPGEPFGADNADDVAEMLPSRSRPAQHRYQAIQFGEPDLLVAGGSPRPMMGSD
jgi:hypothetical protein